MGYSALTYGIQLAGGGVNNLNNYDLIKPIDMLPTSRNFNLIEGNRRKRGGTSRVTSQIFRYGVGSCNFDSGGTTAPIVGDTFTGNTSAATAEITSITESTGAWGDGNQTGTIELDTCVGRFQDNETVTTTTGGADTLTINMPPTAAGVDLVRNGDFTADEDPPQGWTATASVLTTEAGGQVGNCMKITASGVPSGIAHQDRTTVVGKLYKATIYAKDIDTGQDGSIQIGTIADAFLYYNASTITADTWTLYTVTFEATTTTTRIKLFVLTNSGTYYFDEISLYEMEGDGQRIYGMFDYLKPGGTQYTVFATADGSVWKGREGTIKTGWTANKYIQFSQFAGEVYACNGVDMPVLWAGSGQSSALAGTPTDWDTANNKPQYMITHGRGLSERNWAFGCAATPYTLYISPNDDGDDFSDANVTLILVDTKDGYGIVGGTVFQDKLIVFGKSQAFIIDDADTDVTNWGYYDAAWEGGAISHKMIVKTPNDIVVMSEDLDIYSVVAAERYSDYKMASLARPAHIDQWLRDNVAVAYLNDFHAIYDPVLRAIKFFIVRTGQTTVDTCLVYFIDRPPNEAWMIHNSDAAASGYFASCSALKRVGIGNWQVYTGDYSGYVWKLEQSSRLDNAKKYTTQFKTAPLTFDDPRTPKDFKKGRLGLTPQGTEVASISWWVDGVAGTQRTVTATSGVYDYEFELGAKGRRLQYQLLCSASNTDAAFNNILTDFKPLGKTPI